MSNINLYQSEETSEKSVKAGILDKGLTIGVIIFAVVLVGYGGVKLYLGSLDQKINALKIEAENSRNALDRSGVNEAASFQQRLEIMESTGITFEKNNPSGVFANVQRVMLSGVVASEISFQGKEFKISFVADNFEVLAKQILNFKKDSAFQNVQVESSSRSAEENGPGKISAQLSMALSL